MTAPNEIETLRGQLAMYERRDAYRISHIDELCRALADMRQQLRETPRVQAGDQARDVLAVLAFWLPGWPQRRWSALARMIERRATSGGRPRIGADAEDGDEHHGPGGPAVTRFIVFTPHDPHAWLFSTPDEADAWAVYRDRIKDDPQLQIVLAQVLEEHSPSAEVGPLIEMMQRITKP